MMQMQNSQSFSESVVRAIREVVGPGQAALHEPSFEGNELLYLKECIDSTYVSSVGKYVDRFEDDLANFTGAKYAISVVNGTAALHIALKLAGVKTDDEVLIPALTFVATANAVIYCNATPHFVDSEEQTLGMDVHKLREYLLRISSQQSGQCINKVTGRIIRAIVPMHTFGHPSDIEGLISIANDFNIVMIEDAAESLGSFYHGQHTGTFGLFGTLSFNGNKTITTGGGGAILTNDEALARHAKHLTTTAKTPHAWEFHHDEVGYNYRMPNINAALGCAQLERLPIKLLAKRKLFERYDAAFERISGITLFREPPSCKSNYWLQTLILDFDAQEVRDDILEITNEQGIMTRPSWELMSELKHFKSSPRMDLASATSLSNRIINVPSNLVFE
jgi:perosamine synthetase